MKIKGIIFDLDGTLLDSMQCWENVDQKFLIENGVEPPIGISNIVKKMTVQDSAMYFKTQFSLTQSCEEIIDRIEKMVEEQYFRKIPLKENVFETLQTLKNDGYRMCAATATYRRLAEAALKRLKIYDFFEFLLTCSDVDAGKDKPDIYLKSAEKMECMPKNTVVVEDSLHCIETANNAEFLTIGVYDKTSENEWTEICEKSWKSIKNMSEIIDIFRKETT